jgi:hypothetical protein
VRGGGEVTADRQRVHRCPLKREREEVCMGGEGCGGGGGVLHSIQHHQPSRTSIAHQSSRPSSYTCPPASQRAPHAPF